MKTRSILSSVIALGLSAAVLAGSYMSVDDLWKKRDSLDKKPVVVRGKVDKFAAKTSRSGNKYTTFTLLGEKQKISIFMKDHLEKAPTNGDIVEVNGIYTKEKTVGTQTFKDEVDASKVDGKPFGIKIISTSTSH